MKLVRLPIGTAAEPELNCIRIQEIAGNIFALEASVLVQCDDDDATSDSLIDGMTYPSYDAAEAAGIAWAEKRCVPTLHISRSDGTHPFPLLRSELAAPPVRQAFTQGRNE